MNKKILKKSVQKLDIDPIIYYNDGRIEQSIIGIPTIGLGVISKSIKDKKMNSKILKLFFSVIVIFIIIIGIVFFYYKNSAPQQELFLIFEGGFGEIIYDTKLYWDGDKQNAEYICSESITKSWSSSEMKTRITKRGKLQFVQEIFEIVKNNKVLKSAVINKDVNLPEYNINYKKGDTLTIDEVYELFNIIGPK